MANLQKQLPARFLPVFIEDPQWTNPLTEDIWVATQPEDTAFPTGKGRHALIACLAQEHRGYFPSTADLWQCFRDYLQRGTLKVATRSLSHLKQAPQ